MILVDSSVWVGHFRSTDPHLRALLEAAQVLLHPSVIGELACGNLRERDMTLRYFRAMPSAIPATDHEALELLQKQKLWGSGIGWVDIHLLASALLTGCRFWTLDAQLAKASEMLGVAYQPKLTKLDEER